MNNPKQRQDWIFEQLVIDGSIRFTTLFRVYLEKFGKISEITFTKDWKKARARFEEYSTKLQQVRLKEVVKAEKVMVQRNILDRMAAMEILTEIAIGKAKRVEGTVVMPSFNERTRAVEVLAKMEGWFAPAEIDLNVNKPSLNPKKLDYKTLKLIAESRVDNSPNAETSR